MTNDRQNQQPVEPDKLTLAVSALRRNPAITDAEMARVLGLLRPVSARFWRIKAFYIIHGFYPNQEKRLLGNDAGRMGLLPRPGLLPNC